jgi:hypothetical protein
MTDFDESDFDLLLDFDLVDEWSRQVIDAGQCSPHDAYGAACCIPVR